MQAEENFRNAEDDVSVESNATGTSNQSSRAWSWVQINLINDNKHESMKNVITLDNVSTLSLFCNPDMVEDIKKTTKVLELHTNAGKARCNQKASVPAFGEMWFDQNAIANIFAFADLVKKRRISYDSDIEDAFVVHLGNNVVKFKATLEGLYTRNLQETTEKSKNRSHHDIDC